MKNPFAAGFDSLAPKNIIYSAYVPPAQSWRVAGAVVVCNRPGNRRFRIYIDTVRQRLCGQRRELRQL